MNVFKKFSVILLTMLLAFSMTASAFAVSMTSIPQTESCDILAKQVDTSTNPDVYSVDVSWGAMEFTYTKTGSMDWDKHTHQYVDNTVGTWSAKGNTILVTNHSNDTVVADFSATLDTGFTGTFSDASVTLPSAEGTAFNAAPSKTVTFTIDDGAAKTTDFNKIGTITVSLSTFS